MDQSISVFSKKLLVIFWGAFVLTAVVNTLFWFSATMFNATWFNANFPVPVSLPLSVERSLMGYLPSMLPSLLTMAMLWQLIKLFGLYKEGIVFEHANTACYKKLSYLLISTPFVTVVTGLLLSFVLSYQDGAWNLSFNLSDAEITMMVIGLIVKVITVVMERAVELKQESDLTV